MDLREILTVSGKGGLFKLVSKGSNNVIVESLVDKTRMPLFASMQASSLSDICIFTIEDNIPLADVLKQIYDLENGGRAIDPKIAKSEDLKAYMEKVLPQYDRERVHVSDMKKLFAWYNLLLANDLLSFDKEEAEEESKEETPA